MQAPLLFLIALAHRYLEPDAVVLDGLVAFLELFGPEVQA